MQDIEDHPLANIFPLIEGEDFAALVADIKAHGLHDPIDVYQGKILDGRNRYRALVAADVEVEKRHLRTFRPEFYGNPLTYVLSKNLKRRHLNESQRADVAAKLANLSHGGDRKSADQAANLPLDPADHPEITQAEAAEMLNVSERLVRAAKVVHDQGTPELRQSVARGHLAVSAAAQAAKFAPETQRRIAEQADAGEANVVRTVMKQEARAVREIELGAKQQAHVSALVTANDWPEYHGDEALRVGRAAEHIVCADGLMRGWNAFLAGQGTSYDVMFEKNGRVLRVQVKGAQWPRNVNASGVNERLAYSFAVLRRGKLGDGPRLTREHADLVACVALDIGAIAYFPIFECASTIQLEPNSVPDNGYVRTYQRPIREYPLDRAITLLEGEQHYTEFKKLYPPLPKKQFGVLYADPPWSFKTWSEDGMDRSADNHYPTVSTDLLRAVGPYLPAAKDCVLFLWATAPMLLDAIQVMEAWGFRYRSCFVWQKCTANGSLFQGTGYWFRNSHELLLVGTRGDVPAPASGTQWPSLIEAPVGEHSHKPTRFARMIEEYFPTMPKLEMFRRGPARPGWDAWGNEFLPPHDPSTGKPLQQDDVSRLPTSSSGRPAPVSGSSGAGSHSPQIDPWEIPDFCRRTA